MTPAKIAYQEFLRSPFWLELSAQKKAGVRNCQRCGRAARRFESHHVRYPANWFETTMEDLIVLCGFCHDKAHGIKPEIIRGGRNWKPFFRKKPQKGMSDVLKRRLKANKKPKRVGSFLEYPDGRRVYAPAL